MSPCTVTTTLTQFPNLDSNVLRGICKGLCQTCNAPLGVMARLEQWLESNWRGYEWLSL
jgi:hypothetical protein